MRLKNNLLLSILMVLGSAAGLAQTTATIVGTVTDPSGAVVPGVSVPVLLLMVNDPAREKVPAPPLRSITA